MSTPQPTQTPWVDARCYFRDYRDNALIDARGPDIDSEHARTLERHLRRIVEAWDSPFYVQANFNELIAAAKEELSR